jgi:excisionase family DNA binding protein
MAEPNVTERKGPTRAVSYHGGKLLLGRHEAAEMLSISCRALDYLIANKQLAIRRIGSRVLIPVAALEHYSNSDHPERIAG